jgi:hypothetical protein
MAILIGPVKVASAHARIQGHVVRASRCTAILDISRLYACEDLVELRIADAKAVVMARKLLAISKVKLTVRWNDRLEILRIGRNQVVGGG